MMNRDMSVALRARADKMPIIGIVGPRQSGKTTLAKAIFADLPYVNLEDPQNRQYAQTDPKAFLQQYQQGAIFDEVQKVPDLFSYLQVLVDEQNIPGRFVLTGSQHFLMLANISQSLAGRIALFNLLPLSLAELGASGVELTDYHAMIFQGGYPRLYQAGLSPAEWFPDYIQTYIERDVRQVKSIQNLAAFHNFVKMCAGRIGQVVNLTSLGNDCGITHNTVKEWLKLLEASFILFLLKPYHNNFGKQLIKSPKLYFYDTGLACSLLDIEHEHQLTTHYLKGALFENMIINELLKQRFNQGLSNNLYFWRDKTGHEIDCISKQAKQLVPIEMKAGKTIVSDYFSNITYWRQLNPSGDNLGYVIYGGDQTQLRHKVQVMPWHALPNLVF